MTTPAAGKDVEDLGGSHVAGGILNWPAASEKTVLNCF